MKKQMKRVIVIFVILSSVSVLAYAIQPETPKLPELVQNIYEAVLGVQSSSDEINDKIDTLQESVDGVTEELETVVRMETHSDSFNLSASGIIESVFYDEVRHVSLSFYGSLLTSTEEEYVVSMRVPYPDDLYYSVPVLWVTIEDGAKWHHVEFDTDHWMITGNLDTSLWLAGGYHATSIYIEKIE